MERIRYLSRSSRAASTFNGSYQTLGSSFASVPRILKLINDTDQDIDISTDGTTDHDYMSSGSYLIISEPQLSLENKLQIYVKGAVGTGSVYLVSMEIV